MPHESHQAPFNRSPQILADRYYRGLPVMLTEKPGDDRQHRQPAELGHISDARALLFGSCALFTTTPSKAGRMYPQRGESLEVIDGLDLHLDRDGLRVGTAAFFMGVAAVSPLLLAFGGGSKDRDSMGRLKS